jgi:hypothetical protein
MALEGSHMVMLSWPLSLSMEMLSGRPQQSVTSITSTADPVRGRDRSTLVDLNRRSNRLRRATLGI